MAVTLVAGSDKSGQIHPLGRLRVAKYAMTAPSQVLDIPNCKPTVLFAHASPALAATGLPDKTYPSPGVTRFSFAAPVNDTVEVAILDI